MGRILMVVVAAAVGACACGDDDDAPDGPMAGDAGADVEQLAGRWSAGSAAPEVHYGEEHESVSWKCSCADYEPIPGSPTGQSKVVTEYEPITICIGQRDAAREMATAQCRAENPGANCGCTCCATYARCTTTALDQCFTGKGIEYGICTMGNLNDGWRCKLADLEPHEIDPR